MLVERWRRHYNQVRPHRALGLRPPAPETIAPQCASLTFDLVQPRGATHCGQALLFQKPLLLNMRKLLILRTSYRLPYGAKDNCFWFRDDLTIKTSHIFPVELTSR